MHGVYIVPDTYVYSMCVSYSNPYALPGARFDSEPRGAKDAGVLLGVPLGPGLCRGNRKQRIGIVLAELGRKNAKKIGHVKKIMTPMTAMIVVWGVYQGLEKSVKKMHVRKMESDLACGNNRQ